MHVTTINTIRVMNLKRAKKGLEGGKGSGKWYPYIIISKSKKKIF